MTDRPPRKDEVAQPVRAQRYDSRVDLKAPQGWPHRVLRAVVALVRPFGVTLGAAERHPWESMRASFGSLEMREHYLGTTHVAIGESRSSVTGRQS